VSRVSRLLVVALISASLAVFANGSSVLAIRKVALGVAMADSRNPQTLEDFTTAVGRKPALWTLWSDWGDPASRAFPTDTVTMLKSKGIAPVIMWEPLNPSNQTDCTNWSNAKVLERLQPGYVPPIDHPEYDYYEYVKAWAEAAKASGSTILLRVMHEMNGYWYIWGVGRCSNTYASIKSVWRTIWNIVKGPEGVGATNVKFVWSVTGTNYIGTVWPGDTYVDYIGISAFNWGKNTKPGSFDAWRSMVTAIGKTMSAITNKINSQKPIIIAELGSADKAGCATCKPDWVSTGYPATYKKWSRIKAIVYLNMDLTAQGATDWRLTTPPLTMNRYKVLAGQARFQGLIP